MKQMSMKMLCSLFFWATTMTSVLYYRTNGKKPWFTKLISTSPATCASDWRWSGPSTPGELKFFSLPRITQGQGDPFLHFGFGTPDLKLAANVSIRTATSSFPPFFFFSFHQYILSISYVQGLVPNSGVVDSEENAVKWLLTGMCTECPERAIQTFVQEFSEQLLCWIRGKAEWITVCIDLPIQSRHPYRID